MARRFAFLLPPLACLLYASLLLALRHEPAVRERWVALIQAPRVVVFAAALLVGLRMRSAGTKGPAHSAKEALGEPGSNPLARMPLPPRSGEVGSLHIAPASENSHARHHAPAPLSAQPSLLIGLSMALASGLLVVWGTWGDWRGVQAGATVRDPMG